MNGSCHIYKWESIPSFPFKRATQLIHMCDTMVMHCIWCHTYEWVMSHIWKEYVTWLIHICDMTHSYVWHDSFICVTWYVWHDHCDTIVMRCIWVMSHKSMRHVTFINESCHTYAWVMSHIEVSKITHMNESYHTYEWVMSRVWMSHVTYTNESCHTY